MTRFKTCLGLYNCNTAKYGAILYTLIEIVALRAMGVKANMNCYDMLEEIALDDLVFKRYQNTYEMKEKLLHECFKFNQIILQGPSKHKVYEQIKKDSDYVAFYRVSPEEVELLKKVAKTVMLKAIKIVKNSDKDLYFKITKQYLEDKIDEELTIFIELPINSIEKIYDEEDVINKAAHFFYSLNQFFEYQEMTVSCNLAYNMTNKTLKLTINWI